MVATVLGCLGFFILIQTIFSPRADTDISHYYQIRNQYWSSKLIQHFPEILPPEATNISMAYFSGFLQAGAYFQLRLKLSPHQIKNLQRRFDAIATHKYWGGDTNSHTNQQDGVPTTFFYTNSLQDDHLFPESYEILVLEAQPLGKQPEFIWNHGYSYGVAISSSTSEIIYWVESW